MDEDAAPDDEAPKKKKGEIVLSRRAALGLGSVGGIGGVMLVAELLTDQVFSPAIARQLRTVMLEHREISDEQIERLTDVVDAMPDGADIATVEALLKSMKDRIDRLGTRIDELITRLPK